MTAPSPALKKALHDLRRDLVDEAGPSISTMRNYRFAILPYDPKEEFAVRAEVRKLSDDLTAQGWNVLSISLRRLLLERLRAADPRVIESYVSTEHRLYARDPERSLNFLKEKVAALIEGESGIAADVVGLISQFADLHPQAVNRTLILIGRAGSLYPFFRSSSLLKHIDGKTRNIPVVLLYPGTRPDPSMPGLSFMGELAADRDYRPRIYS